MIPQDKIDEAAIKNVPLFPVGYEEDISINSFKEGVEFAQQELGNIAIEFANYILGFKVKNENEYWTTSNEELFNKFKQEKYGTTDSK